MKTILAFAAAITLAAATMVAQAQTPGEDPVVLQRAPSQPLQFMPDGPRSTAPVMSTDMPAWQRAKAVRYETKAFGLHKGAVMTGQDVINTASDEGIKTTCTQSVGSTVVPRGSTLRSNEQIVVLRGDLVNICN